MPPMTLVMTSIGIYMVKLPPPVPSKWDIIPVHTSDRAAFKACRRRWSWSSPSQLNLVPKVRVHGVRMPLWFGTGIHYALEHYYNPILSEDPVAVFEAWFNLQWDGGLVTDEELWNSKELQSREPQKQGDKDTYWVKGLNELLPDPDEEVFMAHKELGIGMLNFYKTYAEREDNFNVIMVEHDFSVPVRSPDGNILQFVDQRVVPEEWSFDRDSFNVEKEVHARGRMDLIVQGKSSGLFGIVDHKTAGKIDEDYFRGLDLDEQCTTYIWAAQEEAKYYDLDYKNMNFVVYQALRKAYPREPTMLEKGIPSIDRQKESTTAELFEKCIKDNNLDIIFQNSDKMQSYYTHLVEMGDKLFIQRDVVPRNDAQIKNAGKRLYLEAVDMLSNPSIYPNPTKNIDCLNCAFRGACIATEAGYDADAMIEDGYEANYDR